MIEQAKTGLEKTFQAEEMTGAKYLARTISAYMRMSDRKQHDNQATGIITTTWDSSGFLLDFSSMTIDRYICRYKSTCFIKLSKS